MEEAPASPALVRVWQTSRNCTGPGPQCLTASPFATLPTPRDPTHESRGPLLGTSSMFTLWPPGQQESGHVWLSEFFLKTSLILEAGFLQGYCMQPIMTLGSSLSEIPAA